MPNRKRYERRSPSQSNDGYTGQPIHPAERCSGSTKRILSVTVISILVIIIIVVVVVKLKTNDSKSESTIVSLALTSMNIHVTFTTMTTVTTTTTTVSTTTYNPLTVAVKVFSMNWLFDNNKMNDSLGNSESVLINNPSLSSPGYRGYGSALSLDISRSQYLKVLNFKSMSMTSFTWQMWIYPKTLNNVYNSLLKICEEHIQGYCFGILFYYNKLLFTFYDIDCYGNSSVTINSWHHLSFVYDYPSRIQYIYYDGFEECKGFSRNPFLSNLNLLTIGSDHGPNGSWFGNHFNGLIDDLRFIERPMNSKEILDIATLVVYYSFDTQFNTEDSGPNQINGTIYGGVSTASGRVWRGIQFNTDGAYFEARGLTLTGISDRSYSIALWIRRTSTDGVLMFMVNDQSADLWCIPLIGLTSTSQIVVQSYTTQGFRTLIGPILSLNTWLHVVMTYNPMNGLKLWLNGTLFSSTSPFVYFSSGVANRISLGRISYPGCLMGSIRGNQFYGIIDEFKIYSRELNASEIRLLANP